MSLPVDSQRPILDGGPWRALGENRSGSPISS